MTDWRDHAACRTHPEGPEYFFPANNYEAFTAKQFCADHCPVQAECLDFALQIRPHGIFGGTTAADRKAMGAPTSKASPADELHEAIRQQRIRSLTRAGWTDAEIAGAIGATKAMVNKARVRADPRRTA